MDNDNSNNSNSINSDRSQLAIAHASAMEWVQSPSPTVWRKRFEHIGEAEKGLVTSLVRYDAGSQFPSHGHPEGEELFILEGTFSDEHGDFPAGSYLLNPRGFEHAPFSRAGCTLFVKLRQYGGERHVAVDTNQAEWRAHAVAGVEVVPLYRSDDSPEEIKLVRIAAGARIPTVEFPAGEEIFVLSGSFEDEHGRYGKYSWVRYPAGSAHAPHTAEGCTLYVKKGHLG